MEDRAARKAGAGSNVARAVKPMPFWQAVLYFGLPALLFRFFLYNVMSALIVAGLSSFEAYIVSFTVPSAILFALAFGFYRRDGYKLRWEMLRARFRFLHMTWKDWLWTIGALVVTFLSIGALSPTSEFLVKALPVLAPPDFFPPWQEPGGAFSTARFTSFIGAPLKGNWGVLFLFVVLLFFNIFGEELWWRGYILPRQEGAHGRQAWAANGLLWWLWHLAIYPWQFFALLPICLVLPYVAQRRENTWAAVVIHLQNAAVLFIVLALVLGSS